VNLHQDNEGNTLAFGSLQSQFVDDLLEKWEIRVKGLLLAIDDHLEEKNINEEAIRDVDRAKLDILWARHFQNLQALFHDLPEHTTTDLFTCFWCLGEFPVDILPCGHCICASCAGAVGARNSQGDSRVIWIYECILHQKTRQFRPFHTIHLKPRLAGYRILTLDGGGVRGIIELKILDAIEERLGRRIPIQRFFDLIGGTSAGGHITIGLGIKGWRFREFLGRFKKLCSAAFSQRMDFIKALWNGYSYESVGWEMVLKNELGETGKKEMVKTKVSV
jgi:hypothetical protein